MRIFDLCFAWEWPYDADFANLLDRTCRESSISIFQVNPDNLQSTLQALAARELYFNALYDRASDVDCAFDSLVHWARQNEIVHINPSHSARRAWDKAAMHVRFTRAGLDAPNTIILPSFCEQPDLPEPDLSLLGQPFAIKPAHGGGGKGVVTGATSWQRVLAARQEFPADQYLLQSHITPRLINGRPAWFRLIYCLGQLYPCWWDPCTHLYTSLSFEEQDELCLTPLWNIAACIADLTELELFSTEVAYTADGRFVVVDYINDPIDLRLQSRAYEGVPDQILKSIAREIAVHVAMNCPLYLVPAW